MDAEYMKTLQFKWDVYLLTQWFKHPAFKMRWAIDSFMTKHKVTTEQLIELRRIPKGYMPNKMRVEPFVCSCIPKIGRGLYDKSIDDVFDIAMRLKGSKIDVEVNEFVSMIDKKDNQENKKQMRLGRAKKEYSRHLYEIQQKSNQWHITK